MQNKTKWIIGFLSVTGLAVAMELFAVFDGSDDTLPWTVLIVDNIPAFVGVPVIGAFAIWLAHHFYSNYKRVAENKKKHG